MIKNDYKIEDWVKPSYLEEDFKGDGILDVAVPISEIKTNKKGFAVIQLPQTIAKDFSRGQYLPQYASLTDLCFRHANVSHFSRFLSHLHS